MKCPSCGYDNIEGADACEQCRYDLTDLPSDTKFGRIEEFLEQPIGTLPLAPPPIVGLNHPLHEVVKLLQEKNVGLVLVVHEGALLGVFSERDLLLRVGDRYDELRHEPIRRFMTPNPDTLSVDDPVAFALNRMDVGHYRHIPIMDGGTIKGVLSVRRILHHMASEHLDVMLE